MLRIFSLASIFSLILSFTLVSWAAEVSPTELSVKSVNVLDSATVRINFSDAIDLTSVVLKISKQSDNSAVTVGKLIAVENATDSLDAILDNELEEGSSYTLTVQAAIGVGGSTIIDGAGAQREFVTPSPLKKAVIALNAPANPSAILANDGKADPKNDVKPVESTSNEASEEVTPVETEELPLTGMNPFFFLIVIFPVVYFLLRKRLS